MKITYDAEADILYLVLREAPPVDAVEEPPGTVISYGEDGEPVSIEFLNASDRQLVEGDEVSVTLRAGSLKSAPTK
jgi:uncharacterized protein YuzE